MSDNKKKPMKTLTVEDLVKVVGAGTSDDEVSGGEIEYTQRKSRYPDSKITFPTPPIVKA